MAKKNGNISSRPGLVQKSKQLEDELLRERSLRQDLARSPLAIWGHS